MCFSVEDEEKSITISGKRVKKSKLFTDSPRVLEAHLNKTRSTQIHNVVFFKCWGAIFFKLQVIHYAARIDL